MDAEQDNIDYGSRGWQLDKPQTVKLRDSQQNDKLLKEVYSYVINKKNGTTPNEKWISKELWKYWVQYTIFGLIDGILYRKHQTEPNFENVYQMHVLWERVPTCLSCCMTLLAQVTLGLRKYNKGLVNGFIGRA